MLKFKYFLIFFGTIFVIETNQLQFGSNVASCSIFCDDESVINYKICLCVKKPLNKNKRKVRSANANIVPVSKLIRGEEFTQQRCSNNELWNGSACISTFSLCPGGYHWNGNACIIQSSVQTAALVPSAPATDCKYAKHRKQKSIQIQMPPSQVMPTFSTSPLCPFGFVWSDNGCIHNPSVCPVGYYYFENMCHFNYNAMRDFTIETTTQNSIPKIFKNPLQQNNNENKRLQKPSDRSETMKIEEHLMKKNNLSDKNYEKCCSIMSPRMCRKVSNKGSENWQCNHRIYRKCGDFCSKSTIYLRPKQISFKDPILIIPPPPPRLQKLLQGRVYHETSIGN